MDDEFDTSVDTSSFDDTSSDFSDTSSFDTSTDVGEIMDDTSDEYIEILDTTDLGSNVVEDESENIESLMDDAATDEFSEISGTPSETDYAVESDIVELMDEAALETANNTIDTTDISTEESADDIGY